MSAKFIYNACFVRESHEISYTDLVVFGFGMLWRRFGYPESVSKLNYVVQTEDCFRFSAKEIFELVPPRKDELVFIYPKSSKQCSLGFSLEGQYLVASAAVDYCSNFETKELFEVIRCSLYPFGPCLLVAGDELEVDEEFINRMREGVVLEGYSGAELLCVFS